MREAVVMAALLKMRAQKNMTKNSLKTRKVTMTDHAMTDQKKGRVSLLQARTAKKKGKESEKKKDKRRKKQIKAKRNRKKCAKHLVKQIKYCTFATANQK